MPTSAHKISTQHGATGAVNHQTDRMYLEERFLKKPGVNGDVGTSTSVLPINAIANKDFEIVGSGNSTDDVTFATGGGIKCETDGGGTNSVIITPHLDTNQTAWASTLWSTDQELSWGCIITTGSSVADVTIFAGVKLTLAGTVSGNANAAFFRMDDAASSGRWEAISSNAGTDCQEDTGVLCPASTTFKLELKIDASQNINFFIDGRSFNGAGTLNGTHKIASGITALIPYIGVIEDTGSAKHMYIRRTWISQTYPTTS